MPVKAYSYKLKADVYLLLDREWAVLKPILLRYAATKEDVGRDMDETGKSMLDALAARPEASEALHCYHSLTGAHLDHAEKLWAVNAAEYGAFCPECSRPFRTPRAKICAECGFELPAGKVAGQLEQSL